MARVFLRVVSFLDHLSRREKGAELSLHFRGEISAFVFIWVFPERRKPVVRQRAGEKDKDAGALAFLHPWRSPKKPSVATFYGSTLHAPGVIFSSFSAALERPTATPPAPRLSAITASA
jgi:hypothetical protein